MSIKKFIDNNKECVGHLCEDLEGSFTNEDVINYMRRIAVDFDGPIHSFHDGWRDGEIYGYPVPGCKEALKRLKNNGFEIAVHTARIVDFNGDLNEGRLNALKIWLDENEIPYDFIEPKIPAILYIDDRAVNCNPVFHEDMNWDRVIQRHIEINEYKVD